MKKEEFFRETRDGTGPLEGIRILEATTAGAGPWAATVLVDLGAESIKVEMPGCGDMIRGIAPYLREDNQLETSTWHLSINRNKKSITLDLHQPQGQEVFRELAQKADILIQNCKPGTLDRWGLGYEDIRKVKPDIIYTSISVFGQFGPYQHRPGYDPVGQAMGGVMSITGFPDDPPTKSGGNICDNMTGWMGAIGTLAALQHRNRTGQGQHVDISMVDTMLYVSEINVAAVNHTSWRWPRIGNRYFGGAPANTYPCKDGYVCICLELNSHWARFCQIIGREDLVADPRCRDTNERYREYQLIDQITTQWIEVHTVQEVVDILGEAGLVVAPVLNFEQILQDPHIRERGMVAEIEHPRAGRMNLYGVAAKYSRTPGRVRTPAPLLGQHNQEVYGGLLGYSSEKIAQLKEAGVI